MQKGRLNMNIRKILGTEISPEAEDVLDMVLAERFQKISDMRCRKEKAGEEEIYKRIEDIVKANYSRDPEECEKFLEQIVFCESGKEEDFYLYGLKDGIRIMRIIMML